MMFSVVQSARIRDPREVCLYFNQKLSSSQDRAKCSQLIASQRHFTNISGAEWAIERLLYYFNSKAIYIDTGLHYPPEGILLWCYATVVNGVGRIPTQDHDCKPCTTFARSGFTSEDAFKFYCELNLPKRSTLPTVLPSSSSLSIVTSTIQTTSTSLTTVIGHSSQLVPYLGFGGLLLLSALFVICVVVLAYLISKKCGCWSKCF